MVNRPTQTNETGKRKEALTILKVLRLVKYIKLYKIALSLKTL